MVETIITSVLASLLVGVIGYVIGISKTFKRKISATNKALMMLLQTNLTTTYYIYEPSHKIPDYVYKNWLSSLKIYEELGGDDYVHTLQKKMESWDFTKTDILK